MDRVDVVLTAGSKPSMRPPLRPIAAPVLLLALTAQSSAPLPREGWWEQSYEVMDVLLDKDTPPEIAEMITSSFEDAFPTEIGCKGPDELLDFSMASGECDVGETAVADGSLRSSLVCRNAEMAMSALVEGTYRPDQVRMKVAVVVDSAPNDMGRVAFTIVSNASRLRDCD